MRPQAENHIDRTTPLPAPVIQASTPCLEPPAWAAQYGYPLDWLVPGDVAAPAPDADPRLGAEMRRRLGSGDVVGNLGAAGLVFNAFLVTGDPRCAGWLADYVGAWQGRAAANGGLVPDNTGADGAVGSQLGGRWYGGHYGWSWPHGLYSVAQAALTGALAAALANADDSYLGLPRRLLDAAVARGRMMPLAESDSSIIERWRAHLGPSVFGQPILLVPYRHSDRGWFDWNPVQASVPVALWQHTADPADEARLDRLRAASGYDWTVVRPFRDKEEAGHEEPWYAYLRGDNPSYPVSILAAAQAQARRRLALMESHAGDDPGEEDIHLWQNLNPVVTEALTQLTWGAPQVLYNGGPVQARVRYYDALARRPGLPPDVAALVSSIDPVATVVTLVNLAGAQTRSVVVQAGAFGQHDIAAVTYDQAEPGWAGSDTEYISHEVRVSSATAGVGGPWLEVRLPAGTQVTLTLRLRAGARLPSLRTPWARPVSDAGRRADGSAGGTAGGTAASAPVSGAGRS